MKFNPLKPPFQMKTQDLPRAVLAASSLKTSKLLAACFMASALVAQQAAAQFLQTSGDLVVELRSADLFTGISVWTNRAPSINNVGNFTTCTTPANELTLITNGGYVALNVGGNIGQAVQSSGLVPTEFTGTAGATGKSLEAWVYPTSIGTASDPVVNYGANSGGGQQACLNCSTAATWGAYNGCDQEIATWSSTPTVGAWQYLAATVDSSGNINVYTDGAANGSGTGTSSVIQTLVQVGAAIAAGTNATTSPYGAFTGYIASARLETGVLTAAQILNNYNLGALAAYPITVTPPTTTGANLSNSYTVSSVITLAAGPTYTYQWYVSNATPSYSSSRALKANNPLNNAAYGYANDIYFTNGSGSITASGPVTLSVSAGGGANEEFAYFLVVSCTNGYAATNSMLIVTIAEDDPPAEEPPMIPTTYSTNYVDFASSFYVPFVGASPITYLWYTSVNPNTPLASWTSTGVTSPTLTLANTVVGTNYYYVQASNAVGTARSEIGTNIVVVPPPLPKFLAVQYAGDIIAELDNDDLVAEVAAGAKVWTNRSLSPNSVGNFSTVGGGALNGSTAAFFDYNPITSLNIAGTEANVLQSAQLIPGLLAGNGAKTLEVWAYASTVPTGWNSVMSYGNNSGNYQLASLNFGNGESWDAFNGYNDSAAWTTVPSANVWHYLVATVTPATNGSATNSIVVYSDGVADGTGTGQASIPETYVFLGAGINGGSAALNNTLGQFTGYIASARLESGILTTNQISNNYAAGPLGIVPVLMSPPSVTPNYTCLVHGAQVANAITVGSNVTLGLVFGITNPLYPLNYVQWWTDNGSGGTAWSAISGATGATYDFSTNSAGPVEFYVVATNNSGAIPIGAVSPVVTVNEVNPASPTLADDISPSGTITVTNTQPQTFSAGYNGSPPMTYLWYASSDNVNWTLITGSNVIFNGDLLSISETTNLVVETFKPNTNWFYATATNLEGTADQPSSTDQFNVVGGVALPAAGTVEVAGDLIVNLQATNLATNATFWLNNTGSAKSAGDFSPLGGGVLNVVPFGFLSTNMDDLGTNVDGDATWMNVLNVGGAGTNGLQSAYFIPTEMSSNGTRSFEAWVYPTNYPANAIAVLCYGNNNSDASGATCSSLAYGATNSQYSAYSAGGTNVGNTMWNTNKNGPGFPVLNAWHYLAATMDGLGNIHVYADGVLNNTNLPGTGTNSDTPVTHAYVGVLAYSGTSAIGNIEETYVGPFLGYIAAARLESGVLTAAQISNNFAQGPFGTVPASLLLPAAALSPTTPPTLSLAINHGTNTLTWPPYATLVSATNVNGPWTPVTNLAAAPSSGYVMPVTSTPKEMFYRVVKPTNTPLSGTVLP